MRKAVLATILASLQSPNATLARCPVDETRRSDAVRFARLINTREALAMREAGAYQPTANLAGLFESAPVEFARTYSVWLVTDGTTYMFRLLDQLDTCHASVFSTNDGAIFTASPIQ